MSEHLCPTGVSTATAVPAEGLSESERRSLSAAMAEPALKKTTDPRVDTIRKWLERVGKIHGWSGEFASEHAAGGGPAFSLRLGVQPGPVAALRLAVPNSTLARYLPEVPPSPFKGPLLQAGQPRTGSVLAAPILAAAAARGDGDSASRVRTEGRPSHVSLRRWASRLPLATDDDEPRCSENKADA